MPHPFIAFLAPGGGELLVVMLALLLLFGPRDAPRILRNFQNLLNKLKRTAADFQRAVMAGDPHEDPPDSPPDPAGYDAVQPPPGKILPPPPPPDRPAP